MNHSTLGIVDLSLEVLGGDLKSLALTVNVGSVFLLLTDFLRKTIGIGGSLARTLLRNFELIKTFVKLVLSIFMNEKKLAYSGDLNVVLNLPLHGRKSSVGGDQFGVLALEISLVNLKLFLVLKYLFHAEKLNTYAISSFDSLSEIIRFS